MSDVSRAPEDVAGPRVTEAPDGSTATYDAERTRQAYAELDSVADPCECAGCRNYRAAWKREFFESEMLDACAKIGIDPAKAFEATAIEFEDGVVLYTAELPFYGTVANEHPESTASWRFLSEPYGTAAFSEGLSIIDFSVRLPWVLSEPYE